MPLSARFVHDVVRDWSFVLRAADLPAARVERAARRAVDHGSPFARELVITGAIEERLLFELIAQALGLAFAGEVRPEKIVTREAHERLLLAAGLDLPPVRLLLGDETAVLALSGYSIDIEHWRRRLERSPGLRGRLVVVPPTVLRGAIQKRSQTWLMRDAVYSLRLKQETFSAYQVATPRQALLAGVSVTLLPVLGWVAPWATIIALSFAASAAFLSCMLIRLLALRTARPLRLPKLSSADPARLPVYSVLVTLYREANVVPQLLVALGKIQWPRSRLEIKFVCEADDAETLSALEAHRLHPCIEVIRVPAMLPRTKPKALAYALPQCAGELVTLYDAEDRPHPHQLLEAWSRFERSDAALACVQAPLVITNGRRCWLSRMFAFEYAGLFRGLLPWLSDQGTILPLGGTSNHFRRAALDQVGGWDPYNVTEDADLGVRLRRRGYRVETISLPTFEDGPEMLRVWLPQRTRWFKGWVQTWLVHMRQPARLASDLAPGSFLIAQVLLAGMVLSALMHPLFLATILMVAAKTAIWGDLGTRDALLALFGLANIAAGYGAFIMIGYLALTDKERRGFTTIVAGTPLHWLLLSVAAWRAIYELLVAPHRWNKTPHKPSAPSL